MKKRWLLILPILTAVVILLLFRFVFLIGYVPSESMEPTLEKGSLILGSRVYGELSTGDIVVFEHNGELFVKRIAGCPGEEIVVEGKTYYVPPDSYFMLGDNSENSYDSRYWEEPYVTKKNIIAKMIISFNGID